MTEQQPDENEFSLLHRVPTVLRARDFRLYTSGGRRLVDLWQNGGAAILGHTPPSVLRELKNTASRGLYAPFPHFLEGRYTKALSGLFPDREFRLYAAPPQHLDTLVRGHLAELWRPFTDPAAPFSVSEDAPAVLIPVVPGIQGWRKGLPLGLCVLAVQLNFVHFLPSNDFLPPVTLAAAARGIYDLVAAAPARAQPAFPRVAKALKNSRWQRRGLYLSLVDPPEPEEWAELFMRFLENGFLLPPVPSSPVILPGILSGGEEAKLAALLSCS